MRRKINRNVTLQSLLRSLTFYGSLTSYECLRVLRQNHRPLLTAASRKSGIVMPRYFFNTRLGDEVVDDPDGEVLRNPDHAWEVARSMIMQLLRSEGAQRDLLAAVLEVTDEQGEIVLEFPFTEALLDSADSTTRH